MSSPTGPDPAPPPRPSAPMIQRVAALEEALRILIGRHNQFVDDVSEQLGL